MLDDLESLKRYEALFEGVIAWAITGGAVTLALANVLVIIARLTHHKSFAERISTAAYKIVWPLRLGGFLDQGSSRRRRT